jgi:hypothetical protein
MAEAILEGFLALLIVSPIDPTALVSGVRIPTERPMLEDFVTAGWAANPIADYIIDFQLVGVDDHAPRVTLYEHYITLRPDFESGRSTDRLLAVAVSRAPTCLVAPLTAVLEFAVVAGWHTTSIIVGVRATCHSPAFRARADSPTIAVNKRTGAPKGVTAATAIEATPGVLLWLTAARLHELPPLSGS